MARSQKKQCNHSKQVMFTLQVDQAEKMVYIKANLQVKETDDAVELQMDTVMDD